MITNFKEIIFFQETNAANSKAIKDKIKKNAKLRNQMLSDFQDFERKAVSSALSRRFYAQSKDAHYAKGYTRVINNYVHLIY